MSILARYRKHGGFKQLLKLIETSTSEKREKLLTVIEKEDAHWATEIRAKALSVDRIFSWKSETLYIITKHMKARHLCLLIKRHEDLFEKIKPELNMEELKKIEDLLLEVDNPLDGEYWAACVQIMETVRHLDDEKVIMLREVDPSMHVGDAA